MSNLPFNARLRGGPLLASVATVALIASAAFAETSLSSAPSAQPAAVVAGEQVAPGASFAPLIDKVKPAVVSVKVSIENADMETDDDQGGSDNVPPQMRKFFHQFGDQNGQAPEAPKHKAMALGSGFFISADGYIVTNNHVVEHAKTVSITTDDGKELDAKVIGTDPKTDLALIKVNAPGNYPFVSFAKAQPRIGDWVVAIGNPFGLGGTVTAGIVSAEGRDIGNGPYDQFLQIDAPINKGNSGGPTFNLQGQVVGVNTAIFSPSGGSVGIGFDIPATTVDSVVNALEHGGSVSRGFLGVSIQSVDDSLAEGLGMKKPQGALIDNTTAGTPAAAAGLKAGDVITALNGEPVKDASDLTRRVGALKPGEKVELGYIRDGSEMTASVTLGELKPEKTAMADSAQPETPALLGVQLAPASEAKGAGDKGVAIVKVDPNGAAATQGISEGDVILQVSGKAVSTPDQVKSAIASAKQDGKKAVLMQIHTAQGERFVAFAFPKA